MNGSRESLFRVALLWLITLIILAALADAVPLPAPLNVDLSAMLKSPTISHPAGTDELGRDVLSRILHSARSTLVITAGASFFSILLGVSLGSLAGYLGGWTERAVGILIDLFWSVPFVIFVVLIVSIVGVTSWTLILTIGGINWVGAARVARAETARLREADFLLAAKAHGLWGPHLIVMEVLPNLCRTILTISAYAAMEVMTLETGLAFLGLSLPAPTPTWGGMLADGLSYFSSAWWIVITTAATVTATLGSLQLIARRLERAAS